MRADGPPSKQRGRPREFDRDEVLGRAMLEFWANGYDGTTLTRLQERMGLTAPSFYAAFESKDALFREAVELFAATEGAPMVDALSGPDARAAIENLLRASAASVRQPGKPSGCLLVTGTMTCTTADDDSIEAVRDRLSSRRDRIERRLERGVASGELPAGLDPATTATYLSVVIDGLTVAARAGVPASALDSVVDRVLATWPGDEGT